MTDPLLLALAEWVTIKAESLAGQGYILYTEECADGDPITSLALNIENSKYLGRFAIRDNGEAELGCANIRTQKIRSATTRIYVPEDVEQAVERLLAWMEDRDHPRAARRPAVCPKGKISYGSRSVARKAAKTLRGNKGYALTEYKCEYCPSFHLMSSTSRRNAAQRRNQNA